MERVIKWFVHNSVAANMFMFFILIAGFLTIPRIKMEVFPDISIDVISVSETDIDTTKRLRVLKVEEPETRKAGVILNTVDELIQKLKNDEKVI